MRWWYYPSGRLCPLGHKWVVSGISKDRFEAVEHCSWCGKRRVRGLLPEDEQKRRATLAHAKGKERRRRLQSELEYELAKRGTASGDRIQELRELIQHERKTLLSKIGEEAKKGKSANRLRLRELMSEFRGFSSGKV
jgi:hypothetical protein